MSEAAKNAGFQQRLGLFDASMLVAGTMIGSGIFIVSADIARDVGSSGWLLAVWAIAGVMTVLGALAYAELAAMMPHAGGQYIFLREAYSPLFGFLYGWTSFTVIQTGTIAAVGVAFAKFLGVLIPALGTGPEATLFRIDGFHLLVKLPFSSLTVFERTEFTITAGQLVGVALVLALTLWNTLGIDQGKWVQNIFTVAKIGSLLVLIAIGLFVIYNADVVRLNFGNLWGNGETKAVRDLRNLVPASGTLLIWMVAGGALVGALLGRRLGQRHLYRRRGSPSAPQCRPEHDSRHLAGDRALSLGQCRVFGELAPAGRPGEARRPGPGDTRHFQGDRESKGNCKKRDFDGARH